MSKKVLVLSGSPRKGGNSDLLCDQFVKGAKEAGHQVEKVFVNSKKISPCKGCYYCENHNGLCSIKDDMAVILDKIQAADVVVLASPVYFYSISAQMKTVIDRCVARWQQIENKDFYYIMTAADDSKAVEDCTLECFRGFASCLEGSQEKGVLCGKGVHAKGEIKEKAIFKKAYEMGRKV